MSGLFHMEGRRSVQFRTTPHPERVTPAKPFLHPPEAKRALPISSHLPQSQNLGAALLFGPTCKQSYNHTLSGFSVLEAQEAGVDRAHNIETAKASSFCLT